MNLIAVNRDFSAHDRLGFEGAKVMQQSIVRPTAVGLDGKALASARLTTIIPIRIDPSTMYLFDRLSFPLLDPTCRRASEVLVVDDGTPYSLAADLKARCEELGFGYARLESSNEIFSIARARNFGASVATTDFIFFMDADLLPPVGFFRRLDEEITTAKLAHQAEDMIMIPVSYLTEDATADYLDNQGSERYSEFLQHTIDRDPRVIEKFSSGTSACVYSRLYYLARGGNIEMFKGWGFEDLEFNLRVALLSKKFSIPADYARDVGSFDRQSTYTGWKAMYRLFGDNSFLKGLLLFHAWHPIDFSKPYARERDANRAFFNERIVEFKSTGIEPDPIADANRGRSMLFRTNPFTFTRELRPMLGEIVMVDPTSLPDDGNLRDLLKLRGIDRIVFQNPYASPEMRRVYDWARREAFPFLVCERGALNDSILFDQTGFLADSTMFGDGHWDHELDAEEDAQLDQYIQDQTSSGVLLEAQSGPRITRAELRSRLGISSADQLVLVCLQRPTDTATVFFSGQLGSYQNFLWLLEKLSHELPENIRIGYKIHPLEHYAPPIRGVNVSEYHLYDLLNAADKLVVFTSGTGVQAMLWNRPVVTGGRAFYDHPKLTYSAGSESELRDLMCDPLAVDVAAQRRFINYLSRRYYSFGKFDTRQTTMPDGSRMTATTGIKFRVVRGVIDGELRFLNRTSVAHEGRSMLFDRYSDLKLAAAAANPKRQERPNWGFGKNALHWVGGKLLVRKPENKKRYMNDPIDFFSKARHPVNRMLGRILLDKSQRPY